MTNLFVRKDWIMHSGGLAHYKIECDALTEDDYATLAFIVCEKLQRYTRPLSGCHNSGIKRVIGIPRGGILFAEAIEREIQERGGYDANGIVVIVDDVLTTGRSMEEARAACGDSAPCGVVIFARGRCPDWIKPIFEMHWWQTEDE